MTNKNSRPIKKVLESVAGIFINPFSQLQPSTAVGYPTSPHDLITLPTGLRLLDKALGIGGLPAGIITELMSPGDSTASSGAVNIAARIASNVQRKQQLVTIIDLSHNFDSWQAERCGLIAPQLLLNRPDTLFEALAALEVAAHREGLIVVIFGCTTSLLSQASPNLRGALLGRLRNIVRSSTTTFLFLTTAQTNNPFNPQNYPTGFPLAELADIRLWIQDETWTHKDGMATAYKANITVIKNNLAIAGRGADLRVKFSNPASDASEALETSFGRRTQQQT